MKNQVYIGKGWIEVPEAKLQAGNEITGWVVKRDLWFFALYAQVEIKIDSSLSSVNITHFAVHGTEAAVKKFEKILKRAVDLHNQPRFPNMIVPKVRLEMKIKCKQHNDRGRR
jgi:hypothetical protein